MSSVMPLESSQSGLKQALVTMTVKILRPLVKILLRHGMSSQEFTEISRWVYVDVAMQEREFRLGERRQSKSRVAVLTGLSRKEVLRLTDGPTPEENDALETHNRAARVLAGWLENPLFQNPEHAPNILNIKGNGATFEQLVRMYSGDMPYRAVLDELQRTGAVELVEKDRVRINMHVYMPCAGSEQEMEIIGLSSDLLDTMERNTRPGIREKFPQRTIYSLRVPEHKVAEVRAWLRREIDQFTDRAHQYIIGHSDTVQRPTERHRRVGVGLYYFDS